MTRNYTKNITIMIKYGYIMQLKLFPYEGAGSQVFSPVGEVAAMHNQ